MASKYFGMLVSSSKYLAEPSLSHNYLVTEHFYLNLSQLLLDKQRTTRSIGLARWVHCRTTYMHASLPHFTPISLLCLIWWPPTQFCLLFEPSCGRLCCLLLVTVKSSKKVSLNSANIFMWTPMGLWLS